MDDNPSQPLIGQRALVTGSSSGIGRAIALRLAGAGADVVLHACRSREAAEQVAAEIGSLGRRAAVLFADFGLTESQDEFLRVAHREFGPFDIWINNAGADVLTGEAADWSFEEKLEKLWRVDVLATVRLARGAGQRMRDRGQGVVLNIGWDRAEFGMGGDSGELFAATKGAIMAFTRSLARSLAPSVRVNCLAPGWIKTAWGSTAGTYWQVRAEAESLLKRWGTPEDVAEAAAYLVSPAASFITGQILHVNGGLA